MLRFRGLPFKKASLRMTVLTEIEAGTSRVVLMVAGGLIYVVAKKKTIGKRVHERTHRLL